MSLLPLIFLCDFVSNFSWRAVNIKSSLPLFPEIYSLKPGIIAIHNPGILIYDMPRLQAITYSKE